MILQSVKAIFKTAMVYRRVVNWKQTMDEETLDDKNTHDNMAWHQRFLGYCCQVISFEGYSTSGLVRFKVNSFIRLFVLKKKTNKQTNKNINEARVGRNLQIPENLTLYFPD